MTHDLLCTVHLGPPPAGMEPLCMCAAIERIRADERSRIARLVEQSTADASVRDALAAHHPRCRRSTRIPPDDCPDCTLIADVLADQATVTYHVATLQRLGLA